MSLVFFDRVRETTTVVGTNDAVLLGAVTGFQAFSVVGNGNTCYYTIADQAGGNWEVGIGTYSSTGPTLARTTILSSSNGGNKVAFGAGTKDVFLTYPSSRAVYVDGTTITPGTAATLPTTSGGTGLSSYTAGDLPYYATGTAFTKLGIGTNGQVLTSTGTAPQWSTLSGVAVTTFSAGTTGFTPNTATSGAITLAGTLATTNGGTGLTSFTANRVFYASSTSAIGQSANLTFDGTTLTAAAITSTGVATFSAGTVSAPAITTTGDTNTGIFFPAADTIAFTEGGVEAMRIDSSGNVTGAATQGMFRLSNSARSALLPTYSFVSAADVGMYNPADNTLGFVTGQVERMRIDSSGNVLVNTTTASYSVANRGNITIGGTASAILGFQKSGVAKGYVFLDSSDNFQIWNESNTSMLFGTNTLERMRIDSSGNVGIGTSTTTERLNVASSTAFSFLNLRNSSNSAGGGVVGVDTVNMDVINKEAGYLRFGTNNTERMRIDSSGNVGIGTSTPSTGTLNRQLTINSGASSLAGIVLQNNATGTAFNDGFQIYLNGTTGTLSLVENSPMTFEVNSSERMRIDSSGNVLVNTTTASYSVANRGNITIGGTASAILGFQKSGVAKGYVFLDSSDNFQIWNESNTSMLFGTNTLERMRITSGGNLLVGTTSDNSSTFKFKVQAATDVCVGLASATSIAGALTFNFINDGNSANVPVDFRCNGFYISNGLATGAGTNAVKFNTSTKQLTYDTSSARYKDNIRDSIYGLSHVMQMRSAQFEYKDTGNSDVGLIAEELNPIIPELVGKTEDGLPDSVSYDRMVSVLVKAIQEQQAMIEELKAEVALLKSK